MYLKKVSSKNSIEHIVSSIELRKRKKIKKIVFFFFLTTTIKFTIIEFKNTFTLILKNDKL